MSPCGWFFFAMFTAPALLPVADMVWVSARWREERWLWRIAWADAVPALGVTGVLLVSAHFELRHDALAGVGYPISTLAGIMCGALGSSIAVLVMRRSERRRA